MSLTVVTDTHEHESRAGTAAFVSGPRLAVLHWPVAVGGNWSGSVLGLIVSVAGIPLDCA